MNLLLIWSETNEAGQCAWDAEVSAGHCCAQVQEAGVNQVSDPAVEYRPRPTQPQQLRENHTETEGGMFMRILENLEFLLNCQ